MIPIKWGHTPGDVPKSIKDQMMSGRHPHKKRAKAFRNMVLARLRTVMRERTRREIRDALEAAEEQT